MPTKSPLKLSNSARRPPLKKLNEQNDERQQQEQVNQPAERICRNHADQPQD